ncbi:MAG: sugar transferase [Flavobacteriaceae bacterium]|nr:sugar transferase [Flavobacteriaceae bacterium]MDH3796749.1 sugar transferase [Flavobacteriaceae bacterium]
MYTGIVKRIADFFVALTAFLVLSPIIIILIVFLVLANKGNPFFFQKRPGKNAKIFTLIKFRTMNNRKDENGNLLPDKERITKIGRFVRNASLDELLQLINVIKGDMSIVGPRPLLVAYLPLYNEEQAKRHLIKPGITGWAQVNGRNAISWEERFALDVWYVHNISFVTDMKILFQTVKKVLQQDGATTSENDTMPRFMGSK